MKQGYLEEGIEDSKENIENHQEKMNSYLNKTPTIDHATQRYPYCVVWTPLPVISWLLPFIGHTGIADSRGCIYDFAGFFVSFLLSLLISSSLSRTLYYWSRKVSLFTSY
jgi:hypothetical protein